MLTGNILKIHIFSHWSSSFEGDSEESWPLLKENNINRVLLHQINNLKQKDVVEQCVNMDKALLCVGIKKC